METILCPIDFSASAENAVRYANELAQRMNSRIVLYHNIYEPEGPEVISYGGVPYPPSPVLMRDTELSDAQLKKLESLKNAFENLNWGVPVRYETKLSYGVTKHAIASTAKHLRADMIVMGNDEAEGLSEIFHNSVTAEVIKESPCPVLVIPAKATFKPVHRIVFATDLKGEPFSEVSFVTKIAGLFEAEVMFLHIITENFLETREIAQGEFELLRKRLPYKNASFHVKENPQIEEGISQFCRTNKVDMLVMGFHPRSFWEHLLPKDYTQEMAYHTFLPMLVIHYRK